MNEQPTLERLGTWEGPQVVEEPQIVTGSVVEFAFGDVPRSYFVTSYPYRAEYADQTDARTYAQLNMPYVRQKLQQIKPRYIMNVAVSSHDAWFLYCYRGPGRLAYDSKWFPRKPSAADGLLGLQLDKLKEKERDQISFCAFGESSKSFFLRSTDSQKGWHPRISKHIPTDLHDAFQDELNEGAPRAVTFGKNRTWILYGKTSFQWSRNGLPKNLEAALKKGVQEGWSINKVVLNRHDRREYILVFDSGAVYFYFDGDFVEPFKAVLEEWSKGMRSSGRYPDHRVTFSFEALVEEDGDNLGDTALNVSTSDDDSDGDHGILRQNKKVTKPSHLRKTSSLSHISKVSGQSASEDSPVVRGASGNAIAISDAPEQAEAIREIPTRQEATVTRSSSKAPERVPNQPRSPLNEAKTEPPEYDGSGTHRTRAHSRLQDVKEGFRNWFN